MWRLPIALKNSQLIMLKRTRAALDSVATESTDARSRVTRSSKSKHDNIVETQPTKRRKAATVELKYEHDAEQPTPKQIRASPPNWLQTYEAIREMRKLERAPVDDMGCERLADPTADEKIFRFQSLVSLMLSSQTKDEMTAKGMANLQKVGLTPTNILNMNPKDLDQCIKMVGFHNRKTIYLQATAKILLEKYGGDIPDTVEGLMDLPGVGPKMAYLAMQTAWNKNAGIGVDVHVHRITNRLKWVNTAKKSNGPEATRLELEGWLPPEYWKEINYMLVGFGQTICRPVKPRCESCTLRNSCPSSSAKQRKPKTQPSSSLS